MNALYDLYRFVASSLNDGVTEIKKVDIDLGQLKKGGENMPVDYPLLLIRFENVYWKDFDASKQIGTVHLRLKIIYPYVNESEFYQTDHGVRYEVETLYNIVQSVHDIMKDLPPGTNSKLKRFNENHIESLPEEMKWVYCMDYYCNIFSDHSSFDGGMLTEVDYDLLMMENRIFERTVSSKKVG
jgi:hypothetical protein